MASRTERALVTGATGFVGAELVRLLVQRGFAVRALCRPSTLPTRLAKLELERVEGDVTDRASLARAMRGVDVVFHVAGVVSYRTRDAARMHAVNVVGTRDVLAEARAASVRRVVHTSSVVAVGSSEDGEPIDETAAWNLGGIGAYFDTKRAGEAEVTAAVARGQDVVVVNPAAVLGEGDARGNLHQLVRMVLRHGRALVPGGGVNAVDNRDIALGHLLALERGRTGERYVLGSENLTFVAFATRLAAALGKPAHVTRLHPALIALLRGVAGLLDPLFGMTPPLTPATLRSMGRRFWFSCAKAERELGYAP
ncbi:MAG: NAD-dependent epimerase/dehydratase family protein, partial [Planctomycetes bacterium]|nr:NAD-dependent epimerase/dehydratase family protein [Planctomycetota bacterium]